MVSQDEAAFAAPADPRGGHAMVEGISQTGQRHDRMAALNPTSDQPDPATAREVQITLAQKMLSAVSGSVFTSLLGKHITSDGPSQIAN